MERFSRSWALAKESYAVLRSNPQLAFFPVITGVVSLFVTASFAIPVIIASVHAQGQWRPDPVYTAVLFAYYLVSYFVVIYFNSALVSCAHESLNGRPVTLKMGIDNANRHIGQILSWSLISATVGTILRIVSERLGIVGRIVIALLGAAWTMITYFVIPVMIIENQSATNAVKSSASLLKKTWGEQLILGSSLGLAVFCMFMLGLIPLAIGIALAAAGLWPFVLVGIGMSAAYWLLVMVIASSLSGIFNTALYIYASTGRVPEGFTPEYVQGAFAQNQRKKVFGL